MRLMITQKNDEHFLTDSLYVFRFNFSRMYYDKAPQSRNVFLYLSYHFDIHFFCEMLKEEHLHLIH